MANAVVLVDEDWDKPFPHGISAEEGGNGLGHHSGRTVAGIALTLALVVLALAVGKAARRHPPSAHQVICATPTATWSPGSPTQVGVPGAARVGPLTFHPSYSPGQPDTPTRVILHPITAMTTKLTMTGWSCNTGRPLRMWYSPYGANGELPQPISKAPREGEVTVTVPVLSSGEDFIGYMLFPTAGRWDVEIRDGSALVGNILFALPG